MGKTEKSILATKHKKNGEPQLRFVKAKMHAGDYLLCHVNGFKYEYEYMTEEATVTAVGAVAALDEMRVASSRQRRATNLGVLPFSSQSGGVWSSRNGQSNWSTPTERPSMVG